MIPINHHPTPRQLKQFGAALPAFSALGAGLLYWQGWSPSTALTLWGAGSLAALAGFLSLRLMRGLYIGLSYATFPIGWVVSHVLLAIVYYLVVTPIGVVLRIAGRDSMQRRRDSEALSYWQPLERNEDPARYFRQF